MDSSAWPRAVTGVTALVLAAGFALSVIALDRCPPFSVDEPFFNAPAARAVAGRDGFVYSVHTQAPGDGRVWAYQAPLFVRMQVGTFRLFGIRHFACRIPGVVGAYLAVLVLALFLARKGSHWAGLALAVLWCGDRGSQELLLGRPEGVSLLFLVLGFVGLANLFRTRRRTWAGVVGFALGMAAGFSPGAAVFGVASVLLLLFSFTLRTAVGLVVAVAAGAVVPALLVLVCWMPDVGLALRQFAWHVAYVTELRERSRGDLVAYLWFVLQWSRWWCLALLAWMAVASPRMLARVLNPLPQRAAG